MKPYICQRRGQFPDKNAAEKQNRQNPLENITLHLLILPISGNRYESTHVGAKLYIGDHV